MLLNYTYDNYRVIRVIRDTIQYRGCAYRHKSFKLKIDQDYFNTCNIKCRSFFNINPMKKYHFDAYFLPQKVSVGFTWHYFHERVRPSYEERRVADVVKYVEIWSACSTGKNKKATVIVSAFKHFAKLTYSSYIIFLFLFCTSFIYF